MADLVRSTLSGMFPNLDRDVIDDVVRMKIKPEIEDTHQERLRYVVEADSNTEGEIVIYWEKLEVSLPITTKQ